MSLLFSDFSVEIYKSIIENNTDAIYVLSTEGTFIEANPVITRLYGYTKEEFEGTHYQNFIVPDYLEITNQNFEQALQGTSCEYETQVYHKNGKILHILVKNIPLVVHGQIIGVFGVAIDKTDHYYTKASLHRVKERIKLLFESNGDAIDILDLDGEIVDIEEAVLTLFKDITDRKKIERDLKEYQKKLANLNKALDESAIVAITNEDGVIEYANDKFCEISKFSREELIGQNHRIIKSDYHSKEFFENLWKTIARGEIWKGEIRNKAKDGTLYWVETTIVPFLNEEGKPYQYVSIRNCITERKQAEEELRYSEERYRKLVEMSPEPIIVHTDGVIQFVNNAGLKVFKVGSNEELIGKHVLNFVHPEDLNKVIARMQSLKKIGTIENFIEERIVLYDGSIINLEVSGVGVIYEGKPSVQVLLRDVTERKKIEEALRQSEKKYRLIAENMTDLVAITDSKGFVKYASPSHEFVLGFNPKAYEGKVAFDFIHPEDLRDVQGKFMKMIETKESHSVEFRHKHANGDWIWMESRGTPIQHKGGEIQHIHVVSREITERIMYEEKLSYMAYHDLLTGLPNRRLFEEKLKQSLLHAERYHRKLAVMYMDIDKFKRINDTLGHDVGDELLVQFAQRVKECLRESDTIGRQGGDEFTILLPEIQKEQDAVNIARRILSSLQEPWSVGNHVFNTTSSIGIAFYPRDGITGNQLIKNADKALYVAKEDGRNNFKTYT